MTAPELDELLNGYELMRPITLADVDAIASELRECVPAGTPWEVFFTDGSALHVTVGPRGGQRYERRLAAK